MTSKLSLRFAVFSHLVYCRYRIFFWKQVLRSYSAKNKSPVTQLRTKLMKITHRKHQGGKHAKQIWARQINGKQRLASLMHHMEWWGDIKRGKIVQRLWTWQARPTSLFAAVIPEIQIGRMINIYEEVLKLPWWKNMVSLLKELLFGVSVEHKIPWLACIFCQMVQTVL